MRNILMASISAMGILASTMVLAEGTSGGAGVIASSGSLSGAASLGNQIGTIGDNINSRSESNAEPAIAPNLAGLYASPHTCMGSATASVGVGGVFSAGAGSTYQDNECNKREAVKLAAQLGLKQAAAAVFYDIEVVRNVIGNATNAGEVARAEAQALAGVSMVAGNTVPQTANGESAPRSNRPFWCSDIERNNARWDECQ